jgi:hypothetical protein
MCVGTLLDSTMTLPFVPGSKNGLAEAAGPLRGSGKMRLGSAPNDSSRDLPF